MGRVRVNLGDTTALMIDGYVPPYEYFSQLDWSELRQTREGGLIPQRFYYTSFYRYLRADAEPSDTAAVHLFTNLVEACRYTFCPYRASPVVPEPRAYYPRYRRHPPCRYWFRTTGTNPQSAEVGSFKHSQPELLARLEPEYRADETAGRDRYIQNVVVYPTGPGLDCEFADDCSALWMAWGGLQEKPRALYADYQVFVDAWRDLLVRLYHQDE